MPNLAAQRRSNLFYYAAAKTHWSCPRLSKTFFKAADAQFFVYIDSVFPKRKDKS